jgi:hypothetical protein
MFVWVYMGGVFFGVCVSVSRRLLEKITTGYIPWEKELNRNSTFTNRIFGLFSEQRVHY